MTWINYSLTHIVWLCHDSFQVEVDAKVAEWQSHARAVKQSLELLTNICTIPEEEKTDGKVEEKDMPPAWKLLIASPIMERVSYSYSSIHSLICVSV
jgi:hypothetical protein